MSTAETTFSLMFEMGRIMRSRMEGEPVRVSMPQFETLRFIALTQSPTMREVARQLKVKAPSATALVSELERAKYVRRIADPQDRRQVRLEVTTRGREILEEGIKRRVRVFKSVLSPLSSKDRADLNRILKKIIEAA